MRKARRRSTLFLLAVVSVIASALVNLATGPALFGVPHWVFTIALLALASWFTYALLSRTEPAHGEPSLDDVADRLAAVVDTRLAEELAVQDLNQAAPIAMRWRVGDRPGRVRLSGDPVEIQNRIVQRFNSLRYRQVVITGVAGAGKTVLAIWLTRGLNRTREPGDPVAVLVSIADWRPEIEHLHAWLVRHLSTDYGLAKATAESLVRVRVIPVLDGLDELPTGSRTAALRGIHKALDADDPVAVTSRVEEFDLARDSTSQLPNATVVEVEPVEHGDVAAFLRQGDENGHWDEVIAHVEARPDSPLARVLATPLMVWLAKTIYTGRDPAELTDTHRFDTVERLTEHLVTRLTPAVYRRSPAAPGIPAPANHDPDRARDWLAFLAWHLGRLGTTEFQWWRVYQAVHERPLRLSHALIIATVTAVLSLPVLVFGSWEMAMMNTLIAFGLSFIETDRNERPLRHMRFSIRRRVLTLRPTRLALFLGIFLLVGLGVLVGILSYAFVGFAIDGTAGFDNSWSVTIVIIGVFVVVSGLGSRIVSGTPLSTVHDLRADQTLRSDRWVMLTELAVSVVIVEALITGFLFAIETQTIDILGFVVAGTLPAALIAEWDRGSWCRYQSAKLILALTGKLPWRLFAFLEDARRRGVLRRSSAAYQFRHALLQDHLAGSNRPEPPRPS